MIKKQRKNERGWEGCDKRSELSGERIGEYCALFFDIFFSFNDEGNHVILFVLGKQTKARNHTHTHHVWKALGVPSDSTSPFSSKDSS